jgi:hypothetical protein
VKSADPTLPKHWLEYANGIPVEAWGNDHNSTLMYAETRAVDHGGVIAEDDPRMRVSRLYPTRLHNGVEVHGHTDYDCLTDAVQAGFIKLAYVEGDDTTYAHYAVRFTDDGWTYVHNLRRRRAEATTRQ